MRDDNKQQVQEAQRQRSLEAGRKLEQEQREFFKKWWAREREAALMKKREREAELDAAWKELRNHPLRAAVSFGLGLRRSIACT